MTLLDLTAALKMDVSNFLAGSRAAKQEMAGIKTEAAEMKSEMALTSEEITSANRALMEVAGNAAAAGLAFSAITGAIVGLATSALTLGSSFEQAQIGFTTMLGSGQAAKQFLDELKQFAASTPFEFPELQRAATRLQAMGFEATTVIPIMRTVGEAVAALGGNSQTIDRITLALGQMQAKGKVSAQEMNQLAEAGIPAWEALATAIGVSIPEAMKQAENGAISAAVSIPAILESMQTKFGGMMQQTMQTAAGQWSNFKDQLTFILADLGKALLPFAQMVLKAAEPILEMLRGMAEGFAALPQPVQGVIVGIGALVAAIGPLLLAFAGFTAATSAIGTALGVSGISGILGALVPILGPVALAIAAAGAAWAAWDNIPAVQQAVTGLWTILTEFWNDTLKPLITTVAAAGLAFGKLASDIAGSALAAIWEEIKGAASGVWEVMTAMVGAVSPLWEAFQSLLSSLTPLVDPILAVWGGLLKLEALLAAGILIASWTVLKTVAEGFWFVVKELASFLTSTLVGAFNLMANNARAMADMFNQYLKPAIDFVVVKLRDFLGVLANIPGVKQAIEALGGTFDSLKGKVTGAVDESRTQLSSLGGETKTATETMNQYSGGIDKVRESLQKKTVATTATTAEQKKLQDAIKSTNDHLEQMAAKFNGATWDFTKFKEFVREGGNVKSAVQSMEQEVIKLNQKFGKDMPQEISFAIKMLKEGIANMKEFQERLNEEKMEASFEKLNAELAKTHEKFKGIPPLINDMAKAIADSEVEWEKMNRAVQSVSKPITELPEVIQEVTNETARAAAKQGELWRNLGDDIKKIFSNLKLDIGASIGGSIWDSIIGNNDNSRLDEEAAEVQASLAERTAEWEQYQRDVAEQIRLIGEEHAAELDEEIAKLRAALAEKEGEYNDYVAATLEKLEQFKQSQAAKLEEELAELARNLEDRGEEWEAYKTKAAQGLADFTAKQDAELQRQRTDLLGNLAERTTEWYAYRDRSLAAFGDFTREQGEKLAEELEELQSNLAERGAEWQKYRADAMSDLEEFRAKQAEDLADELADLQSSLNEKRSDYNDYVADVNEKLSELQETNEEKLNADLERLRKSFEDKTDAYEKYVEGVNQKLGRIGEDFEESVDDERRETQRSIDDKRRIYDREEREINERIARELDKGSKANQQQIADWKRTLVEKREDLDRYVRRQEEDLAEFVDDHQRAMQRQTGDLQNELEQRKKDHYEARVEYESNVEAVTTASQRELQRQTSELQSSLADRTADWVAYQAEIATKMAEAQTAHDTAISNEETKVRESLADREADWVAYQASIAEKIAEAREAHDEAIAGEAQKVAESLSARQATWEAYRLEIERKIKSAHEAHDAAIATEAAKVAASLAEREAAWVAYQAEIARKLEAAQRKHDDAVAAEELKVFESLTNRQANWEAYQRDVAAKIEAATRKHDEEQGKEVADLIRRMDEKRAEYDKYVADVRARLEEIERDHTTIWGRIVSDLTDTLSNAGGAITSILFEALTSALWDKIKGSTAWKSISEFMLDVFGKIASAILDLFGDIGGAIARTVGIGGNAAAGGASSAAGSVGSAAGSVGGAVGSAAGGTASGFLAGTAGPIAQIASAITGVVSIIQQMGQSKSLGLIEENTRFTQIAIIGPNGILSLMNTHLPKLSGFETFNFSVLAPALAGIESEITDKGLAIQREVTAAKNVIIEMKDYVHDLVFSQADVTNALDTANNWLTDIKGILLDVKTVLIGVDTNTAKLSTTGIETAITNNQFAVTNGLSDVSGKVLGLATSFGSSLTTSLTTAANTILGGFAGLKAEFDDIDFSDLTSSLQTMGFNLQSAIGANNPSSAITTAFNQLNQTIGFYGGQQASALTTLVNRPSSPTQPVVNVQVVNTSQSISSMVTNQGVRF